MVPGPLAPVFRLSGDSGYGLATGPGSPRVYRHIGVGSDGSHFFSDLEVRSDAYRVSASDERRRDGEKWPRPLYVALHERED